jgi:hypothetical protein
VRERLCIRAEVREREKEGESSMTMAVPRMKQHDEALRLLAQMYSRWFMMMKVGSLMENIFREIRDILYHATSQQEAYEQLSRGAEAISDHESLPWKAYDRARTCVEHLIQAGGSADTLIVGQTDGYRHLCLTCSQNEQNVQQVRFFNKQESRPLLKLEVGEGRRSTYSKCQLCLQPIYPQKFVLMTFGGTIRHGKPCDCGECNRAGTAYLVNVYECEKSTQRVLFPFLRQVAAPSRQKGVEQATQLCWEKGWYMFNKDSVLPK